MRILPFNLNRFGAAFVVLAAAFAKSASADIDLPAVPPPQPQPATAKVFIGESVEIPLSGVSRSGAGLQFLIRRPPASGRLSDIRLTGSNTAVVTYTHRPIAGAGMDRFRYAVSSPGRGVSTPAEVIINISERPAVFTAPARLDFPDTSVGQTSTQTLELRNDGGGLVEGRLVVPAPWKILGGDGSYSLGAGGAMTMTIGFAPAEARTYAATASFSHAPEVELGLGGGGFHPIEVVPREIRLETDGRSEVRSGAFLLRNVSPDAHALRLVAPPELVVQDTIDAAPQSETQVALHTRAGFLGALEGRISIQGDGVTLDVPLRVRPAPARLAVKPAALDLGRIETGRTGRAKITLQNTGGSPARLSAKMPEGVEIDPYPSKESLPPGASREFEIRLSRPLPGDFAGTISFETADSLVRLPIQAVLRPSASVLGGASTLRAAPAAPEIVYNDIPPVMQVGVTRQTRTELDLMWKKTSPNVAKYVLFMRVFDHGAGGRPKVKYERLDRVKVRLVRDEARASLAGLRPGESVTLCVVGLDADGVASRVSPAFTFATKPRPVFHFPWLGAGCLVLAILAVLIVRDRRRRRLISDHELARVGQA